MASGGGLLHLWNQWGIQMLVLVSFGLQVFLLFVAGIRRRSSSAALRIALWLAYLLADSTAIYTLGHLSIASSSREHQLVAFWAPFLLLHLGGQDNITAYALEDNSLWLRHLQILIVQVLGASYVVYKYIISGSGTMLCLASLSMFLAGLLKYCERIWALKCGKMSNIRSSKVRYLVNREELPVHCLGGEEEILLRAHSQFELCTSVITDMELNELDLGLDDIMSYMDKDAYKSVEMELSLMYDVLYTKAPVVHTRTGFCIHLVSLLGIGTAVLLFQLTVSSSRGHGYSRVDVVISYVLLVGALVLEAISLFRALVSTWTCYFLYRMGWKRPFHAVTWLRRCVQAATRRRLWKGSIGQCNMFDLCTSGDDRKGFWWRLATKMGQEDLWNQLFFSGTFLPSTTLSTEDLKELVLRALGRPKGTSGSLLNSRGRRVLEHYGVCEGDAEWSVNIDFGCSVLVWHIATEAYISESKAQHPEKLIEATKVLSNYMVFLVVVKPNMLPGYMHQSAYRHVCGFLHELYEDLSKNNKVSQSEAGPSCSRISQGQEFAKHLLNNRGREIIEAYRGDTRSKYFLDDLGLKAVSLASKLLRMNPPLEHQRMDPRRPVVDALELIFQVWVEMMLYAADHCNRDSHARELNNGGEFITIVWLLVRHREYFSELCKDEVEGINKSESEILKWYTDKKST